MLEHMKQMKKALAKHETWIDMGKQSIQLISLMAKANTDILLLDAELKQSVTKGDTYERNMAYLAFYRTSVNLIIGILDVIPAGYGDSLSWIADLMKASRNGIRWLKDKFKKMPKPIRETLSLTPDVSLWKAIYTEGYDIATLGLLPSHLIWEFRLQLQADLPRMIEFLEKVVAEKEHMKGENRRLEEAKIFIADLRELEEEVKK